jgi:MFS transporter, FHS family, L-fucose permease
VTAVTTLAVFQSMGWRGSFPLFFIFMVIGFVSVAMIKVEETKADQPPSIGSSLGLLKEPVFLLAVLGIFLYVGAEASMGRFLLPALEDIGMEKANAAKFGAAMFFLLLTVGRLVGSAVLTVMKPRTFFRLSALLGGLGAAAIMTRSQPLAIAGVVVAGLGFANIWPLLFSITVEEKPERASELSGLMCMAISGGAVVPLVMGQLIDMEMAVSTAFVVPVACFVYLLLLSLFSTSGRKAAAEKETVHA